VALYGEAGGSFLPLREAFASTETFVAVPVMMGTNRDEMKLFYVGDERMTKKMLGVFVVARGYDERTGLARVAGSFGDLDTVG
jgi:hypothetical protein